MARPVLTKAGSGTSVAHRLTGVKSINETVSFRPVRPFSFTIQTPEYRAQPIPGFPGSKLGDCFVHVTDLPVELDGFLKVNPRVPNRTKTGVLSGPVVAGITRTLTESPEDMALKNQGIYLLVEDARFEKAKGGIGELTLVLADEERHGIVNGGHTYAAIRDAIENAEDDEQIGDAYVRLHVLQGIEESRVAEIAEGLNRSKQVDDPSLDNLRKVFDGIKKVMEGKPGEGDIAYKQGDSGSTYITDVLVYLQLFNCDKYSENRHPYPLYRKPKTAADYFKEDLKEEERGRPAATKLLVPKTHEILALADEIKLRTPEAAKRVGFEYGRMKTSAGKKKARAGSTGQDIPLPFLSKKMRHKVTRGWLMPMLAALRANVEWDVKSGHFEWRVPLDKMLDGVIDDLVRVCVTEHRDNNNKPEWVGSRESAYRQCYDKVLLYLARRGKLSIDSSGS